MAPKAEKKKQEKVIEDRTFGLKNKNKSKAVQKFIKGVQNTVKNQGKSANALESQKFQKQKLKKKEQQEQALLNSLYKDFNKIRDDEQQQEDPKNTVCPYFKQGLCQKGKKCIYSHDLTLDRNEEIDLYIDQRTQLIMNQIGAKSLNDLSEEELGKLISEKEKDYIKGAKSDIVCKHFLEAVQKDKYGWNWSCPNGGDTCKYKHCLPPGYVLNRNGGNTKIQIQQVNIEQKIDEQRNKLLSQNKGSPLVTYEVFLKWKQAKIQRKKDDQQKKKKQQQKKSKNKVNLRTGKQLFTYDPTLFIDDEEAADNYDDRQEIVEEEEEQVKKQLREEREEDEQEQIREKQEDTQNQKQEQQHQQNGHENDHQNGHENGN